jgi:hypothetical protein
MSDVLASTARLWTLGLGVLLLLLGRPTLAHAQGDTNGPTLLLQAPVGGAPIPVGPGLIVCALHGGWVLEGNGTRLRPPKNDDAAGKTISVRAAPNWGACGQTKQTIQLLVTGRFPLIEATSSTLYVDERRAEARGKGLQGAQLRWQSADASRSGIDTCVEPRVEPAGQSCAWSVGRDLSADPTADTLRLLPAFAQVGDGKFLYDANGQAVIGGGLPLTPAKIVIGRLLVGEGPVDLSLGRGEVALAYAEAVSGVDCGALDCRLQGKHMVLSSTAAVDSVEVRLRLAPRVWLQRRGALEAQPTFRLTVLRCALALVGGLPVRGSDSAKLVVRLENRCVAAAELTRFSIGDSPLRVLARGETREGVFFVLALGAYAQEELQLSARRSDTGAIVAVLSTPTRPLPIPRASLELPDRTRIGFIPSNREARVNVSRLPNGEYWELVSLPNIYSARGANARMSVLGDPTAEGFVALKFALRVDGLPKALGEVDLAHASEQLQRKIQEANVPVPLVATTKQERSLVEFTCGPSGKAVRLAPGDPLNLPFRWRDTCRLTVHRERLRPEHGRQRIQVKVDVFSADNIVRPEGHLDETLELGAAKQPRHVWIQGVSTAFDRIVVRVSHSNDDAHYVGGSELFSSGPAVQWSVIMGTGKLRIYATSSIPAGLYRFGARERSGVLSLNFGVISRVTWLTDEGHEGVLGLEAGVMVLGLANSTSTSGQSLTEVGIPVGLGLSVPFANRLAFTQASINLHGWVEFPITAEDRSPAFIFGPSISLGNVGTNL